jgi:hypothetical protein
LANPAARGGDVAGPAVYAARGLGGELELKEIPGYELQTDVTPASWLREDLLFPGDGRGWRDATYAPVGAFLPPTFDAYVRVLHEGSNLLSPPDHLVVLAEILPAFTSTPDDAYVCVWEGYGNLFEGEPLVKSTKPPSKEALRWMQDVSEGGPVTPPPKGMFPRISRQAKRRVNDERSVLDAIPKVEFPFGQRNYLLFHGSCSGISAFGRGMHPNFVWPNDRAWCAFTEIDTDATDVGGNAAIVQAIMDEPRFETVRIGIHDRLGPSPFDVPHT